MSAKKRYSKELVAGKFKAHVEANKNPIMAAVKFDRRRKLPGETFDSFVTDLKLLARGLDITETVKLIRNAVACKSLDERVRQRCLEKSKHLSVDSAIDIGRMFEATKDGMQVMAGEDPRVAVNSVTSKPGPPKRRINQKNTNSHQRRVTSKTNVESVVIVPTIYKRNFQPRMNPATNVTN